jgi:putative adenylate-forming enzyme
VSTNSIQTGMLATAKQFAVHDTWNRQQLEAFQSSKLAKLREFAYAHAPFYREFHHGLTGRPLKELPVLTKTVMMEHFDEIVTDPKIRLAEVQAHMSALDDDEQFLDTYWVMASSGSTGSPGIFLFAASKWAVTLASFLRHSIWSGEMKPNLKAALIVSHTPWHQSARTCMSLRNPLLLHLSANDPLEVLAQKLNEWQPDSLGGYPSILNALATEQVEGRLHIHPKIITVSSELLTEEMRQRIETVWGQKIFNTYVVTETGALAGECNAHTGLHLYEDLDIVEVVDTANRPVPPGVYGDKLFLTRLFNTTQPLIRYEVSDRLSLFARSCSCKRPFALVEDIQGRKEDVLFFPGTAGAEVRIIPHVFHKVMDVTPVQQWQIMQEEGGLRVLVSGVREGFSQEALVHSLEAMLSAQGAVVPAIQVAQVAGIQRGATDRAVYIKSNQG